MGATRQAIAADQLAKLRALLAALRPANQFYTRKLAAVGALDGVSSLAEFTAQIPFTTKAELVADQVAHSPYGSNLTFPIAEYTRCHQTSGTSGAPLRWLDTPQSWQAMVDSWKTVLRAADVQPGDRVLFAFSFGPFLGFWLAFEAAAQMGCLCFPGGGLSSVTRLRLLLENRVTVLCCTPTYALRLAEVAAQEKLDLRQSAVQKLLVAGEPGGSIPALRERLQTLWLGARVFDHHGMTETGPVTFQSAEHDDSLQVMESDYFAEVVDPVTGAAVDAGQTGELVLTTLTRTASPVLRYRTGDLVRLVPGTSPMRLAGGILGRADDMVIIRGVNVHPAAVDQILRQFPEISEYRVCISSNGAMAELRVQVELAVASTLNTAHIAEAFRVGLNLRVPVELVPAQSLPRFELKAARWIRESSHD